MLYQLSYPGTGAEGRSACWRAAAIGRASSPVQSLYRANFRGSVAAESAIAGAAVRPLVRGYAIAFVEPLVEIAIAATTAAKGAIFLDPRLTA